MQYAIIGLGRFGAKLATSLHARGGEVLAIDRDEAAVERVKEQVTKCAIVDCTDELSLRATGIQEMDLVVVATGEMIETTIFTTALLKRLGIHRILARAVSKVQAQILTDVGAHEVFSLEEQMGEQMAGKLIAPHILEQITLSSGHSLIELRAPEEFQGKSLQDLHLRARAGLNVVAVKTRQPDINERGENIINTVINDLPSPDALITADDILVMVGKDEKIQHLLRSLNLEDKT
jgi:trk system potassium uptake protein